MNKLGKYMLGGTALTALALAISVHAYPGADGRMGKDIELASVEQKIDERFAQADSDGDGRLSSEELAQAHADRPKGKWRQKKMRRHHKRLMREHEGRAAEGEFARLSDAERSARRAERQAQLFARLDTDGDGALTADEFSHDKVNAAKRSLRSEHRFQRMDTDGSGFIEREEFGKRLERLRSADADGDGIVTRAELRELRAERRAARAGKVQSSS